MKKRNIVLVILMTLILFGCASKEQKAYEEIMGNIQEEIVEEDFKVAHKLLLEALEIDYEGNGEAKLLLEQLANYQKLEGLLNEGQFEEINKTVDKITEVQGGSSIVIEKANDFKVMAKKQHERYNDLQKIIDASLQLTEENKYKEANEELGKIDVDTYEESYYAPIKKTVIDIITSNDEALVAIEAEKMRIEEEKLKKAEAEKKAREETPANTNSTNVGSKSAYIASIQHVQDIDEVELGDSNAEFKRNLSDAYKAWDVELNKIYGLLKGKLSPQKMEVLRKEQRAWIKERDEQADPAVAGNLGQIEVLGYLTQERTLYLIDMYFDE